MFWVSINRMDIQREHLEELITKACPSIMTSAHYLQWRAGASSDAEPLYYLLASAIVRHLTHLNQLKKHDEFPEIFSLIEELHLRGDQYVGEWATIGIIEDLQNTSLHPEGSAPGDFVRFLGPVSKWWWEEVDLFWNGQMKPPIGSSGRTRPAEMGNSGRAVVDKKS